MGEAENHDFRYWLADRSWTQAVRYSKTVAWLMLPAMLALDVPLLRDGELSSTSGLWLLAWQAAVLLTCGAVFLVNRLAAPRGRETAVNVFCAMFMVLATWAGVRAQLVGGAGMVVFVGASTFMATVICTPRPVRRPMYVTSLAVLALAAWAMTGELARVFNALVFPFCFVVLCIELDRFTWQQNLALHTEKLRAQSEQARADKVLYNVLPAPIADELKRNGSVAAVKFDNMGVLFADIAGFTSYSRSLPPDALILVLNQVFSTFDALVDRHGLQKIKTIGDAYMVASHDRIDTLCQFALDLQDAMVRYNQTNGTSLSMRVGVHAGPAVAGVIGVSRFLYDVWGDTVNVASRMEETGRPGAIQVTESVYQRVNGQFGFAPRDPVDIKGRGPMSTWWLTAAAPQALAVA